MKKLWAGVPEGIRTPDPRFRKPVLYPAELPGPLRGALFSQAGALRKARGGAMRYGGGQGDR
jgi:hypothetical protein